MGKKAFTLIELALVLAVIGIMIGGSFKAMKMIRERGKISEAKEQVIGLKAAVVGYALEHPNLPDDTEFYKHILVENNDTHQKRNVDYIVDNSLINGNYDICDFYTTTLKVSKNGSEVDNVAFVIIHGSLNNKIQTSKNGNIVEVVTSDENDDIVEFATLSELKVIIGCIDKPFRIINDRLPNGRVGEPYSATLYVENNVTDANITCNPSSDRNISFSNPNFSQTPSSSGTATFDCFASYGVSQNERNSSVRKFVITIDPASSGGGGSGGTTPNGGACTDDSNCSSGHCTGGVCTASGGGGGSTPTTYTISIISNGSYKINHGSCKTNSTSGVAGDAYLEVFKWDECDNWWIQKSATVSTLDTDGDAIVRCNNGGHCN